MKLKHGYYDVFIRTCARYSSKTAIRLYTDGIYKNYTYSELYGVCEYISQNLQQLTCNKGIIGLISERNIIIPSVVAAAHKCSTTFMFLDPTNDIEKIANDVKFTIIITIKDLERHGSEVLNKKPDKILRVFNLVIELYNLEINGSHHSYETHHSYIAMTSGSTGEPKHIQVPIQCMQPNIEDLTKLFEITPSDVIYFSTPLTFDPSMIEILLSCMNGASLLIAPEKADILFPENNENSITFWQTTPSKFFQHSNLDIKNKILSSNTTLKTLALGGEPLKGIKRLKELKETENNTRIFALYGVTEMSCWACVAELDLNRISNDQEVPLGKCLSETEIILKRCHKHNTGKIILASKSRKCTILNKAIEGTDEGSMKYIDTGDLGEIKNGTIYYRGRMDDVIKRFGHKVNLQIIETAIMQCPRVKTSSCIWLPKPMLLVVYFSSETLSSQELSDYLKCKLDDKHWPDKILRVDNLPINPHGKTSKQILSQMFENTHITQSFESLKMLLLKEFKNLFNKDFTYDEIKDTDFFSIGGTSFLAVALCNKISTISHSFGKFILPYLISQKNTLGEIMLLAVKELGLEEKKSKKRLKRSRSITDFFSTNQSTTKKIVESASIMCPVEFVVAWTYDTRKCVDASPTLFQNDLNLYVTVGSHSGKIVVIDAINGITQGTVKVKSRVEAPVLCYSDPESATPYGFVGSYDGTIVCFKLEDCTEIWRINIGSMVKSKGVYCKGRLYIASYDGVIRCIDATSGEIQHAIHIADHAISADLVLAKNKFILLGTLSGLCASVHSETQTVAWRGTVGSPVFSSPVLYDNDKYVVFAEVNGEIHCRTVKKGIKIWNYQGAKGNIFSSIYIKEVDKFKWQMVFGCHDSNVYNVNIKNFQPSLHWQTQLTSPVYSTPCSFKDKYILAASNNGKLCILNSEIGSIVSEYQLPNETFSSPVVNRNYIFIGCRDDNLYCIKFVMNESNSII